ncbi:MAG TPA: hypothetical protein VH592_09535, partial [Gemmataceae bacterium]
LPELNQASPVLLFLRIARFAVGHEDALLSEGLHHGCQERDPPDRHAEGKLWGETPMTTRPINRSFPT